MYQYFLIRAIFCCFQLNCEMFFKRNHGWRSFYGIFMSNYWLRFLKNLHSNGSYQEYIFDPAIVVKKKSSEGCFL